MSQNVFIADLHHPGGDDPEINRLLEEIPSDTKRLFLMGDIFHYWVNDESFIQKMYSGFLAQLKALAGQGIQLFFIEGNRDFLASHYLDEEPWIDVLLNPSVIELGGRAVYLGHGDELCWNDWQYQLYKTFIRSDMMRYIADRLPSGVKRKTVERMSNASKTLVSAKNPKSLEVPRRAYEEIIGSGVHVIVHGHLHQTYQRQYTVGGFTGQVSCFGWHEGKRNMIHFEG